MRHPFDGILAPGEASGEPEEAADGGPALTDRRAFFGWAAAMLGGAAALLSARPAEAKKRKDRITTQAIGEEGGGGRPTTKAIGEEGGGGKPWPSTKMRGEEGGGTVTTLALGEEGGTATTLAIGEEGGSWPD